MTTILAIFLIALLISIVLTPLAGKMGLAFGAVDAPGERKVHRLPLPRIGGLAVALSFLAALAIADLVFRTRASDFLALNRQTTFALIGGLVVFGIGFADDFRSIKAPVKLVFQIAGASIAFWGGVRIGSFALLGTGMMFGMVESYILTVFWFLLFINAVNLIDGLDGLAAGISFFASLVMVVLAVMKEDILTAMMFAALGGAVLGFLRYNFNPATVFLGDGGSYGLGYAIACLSIMGSVKSSVGAAMLIPLLAMGVPIFDTILSPLRRFFRGRAMFRPDDGHIHHRLVGMGLSARNAVLIIYGISFGLCLLAIAIVNVRNEVAGLFFVIVGAAALIVVRKLGYVGYFALDKVYGWFRDVSDVAGLTQERRTFLSLQLDVDKAKTMDELWEDVCKAMEMLHFDRAELRLWKDGQEPDPGLSVKPHSMDDQRAGSPPARRRQEGTLDSRFRGNDKSSEPSVAPAHPPVTPASSVAPAPSSVTPAKAGDQRSGYAPDAAGEDTGPWIPAFAGMTGSTLDSRFRGNDKEKSGNDKEGLDGALPVNQGSEDRQGAGSPPTRGRQEGDGYTTYAGQERRAAKAAPAGRNANIWKKAVEGGSAREWTWVRGFYRRRTDITREDLLKIEFPLFARNGGRELGLLILIKDVRRNPLDYYTFRRLENLRRSLTSALTRLTQNPPVH
ncbi:MAG TPA: MraY family glycosyltransferase [Smithellaceae bacterium]|nr:MraY family glycosyltransferase [Smithellaceae bacterium]